MCRKCEREVLGKSGLVFPKLTNVNIHVNSNFQSKYPAKH